MANCQENQREDITLQDVKTVAQRITHDPLVKILDYNLDKYSKENFGLLGCHRILKIVVQKENATNSETLNLFVKSIPYDQEAQVDFVNKEGIFVKETFFFSKIVPRLTENYVGEKWSPTCFLVKDDLMIMEDLRSQGYKMLSKSFDEIVILKATLTTIARFHACSMLLEARLNTDTKHYVTLEEFFPNSFTEISFKSRDKINKWVLHSINLSVTLGERLGRNASKLSNVFDKIFDVVKPSKKYRNVIGHGDLWGNNIMYNSSFPQPKCILVDFQIIRYAPLVLDLLQFLYLHTSRDFRCQYEKELIQHYHSHLEETLKSSNLSKNINPVTLDDILQAYEELRVYGSIMANLYMPIILLDSETFTRYTRDTEGFNNFIFGDRTAVTLLHMEKDKSFKSKIEEILIELSEIADAL